MSGDSHRIFSDKHNPVHGANGTSPVRNDDNLSAQLRMSLCRQKHALEMVHCLRDTLAAMCEQVIHARTHNRQLEQQCLAYHQQIGCGRPASASALPKPPTIQVPSPSTSESSCHVNPSISPPSSHASSSHSSAEPKQPVAEQPSVAAKSAVPRFHSSRERLKPRPEAEEPTVTRAATLPIHERGSPGSSTASSHSQEKQVIDAGNGQHRIADPDDIDEPADCRQRFEAALDAQISPTFRALTNTRASASSSARVSRVSFAVPSQKEEEGSDSESEDDSNSEAESEIYEPLTEREIAANLAEFDRIRGQMRKDRERESLEQSAGGSEPEERSTTCSYPKFDVMESRISLFAGRKSTATTQQLQAVLSGAVPSPEADDSEDDEHDMPEMKYCGRRTAVSISANEHPLAMGFYPNRRTAVSIAVTSDGRYSLAPPKDAHAAAAVLASSLQKPSPPKMKFGGVAQGDTPRRLTLFKGGS